MDYTPTILALGTVWAGAAVIGVRALQGLQRQRYAARHAALPVIADTDTYRPTPNPWRVGSTVLVCEDITRPELNWFGTVISTNRNMVTLRDNEAPFTTVETWKERVFSPDQQF